MKKLLCMIFFVVSPAVAMETGTIMTPDASAFVVWTFSRLMNQLDLLDRQRQSLDDQRKSMEEELRTEISALRKFIHSIPAAKQAYEKECENRRSKL